MANVTDLMSNVYDLLSKQFSSLAGSGTFLQMSWPGVSLSPADFKPFNAPDGPYDANSAEETVSSLANIAPVCNPLKFENSGYELDDLYQILITGAVPQATNPNDLLASPAYKLFSDAQFEFISAQKGSTRDPNYFYYPCRVTPIDWYTEENAKKWNTLSLASNQVKPASTDSPFVKLGGRQLVDAGVLKVLPTASKPAVLNSELQTALGRRASVFEARAPMLRGDIQVSRSVRSGLQALPLAGSAVTLDRGSLARRFIETSATRAAKTGLRPTPVAIQLRTKKAPAIDTARFDVLPTKDLTFSQKLFVRNVLAEQLVPKTVASTTDSFSISFKYCLVTIERNWLKLALLSTKNWYMFGTKAAEYSQGRIDNNPGMFPMIPSAFIAIRDLKIVANWSQQDAQAVAQAKYFGPFDIRSGTFNQGAIEAKQLQVIAWLSRLTPSLPPLKDPALPA